jgi:nucleoside-diphosphate-sugar epimerase
MHKILLTGAAGFIGSHVADYLLNQGHQVFGIDNFDDFYLRSIKEQNLSECLLNPSFTFIEGIVGDVASLFPDTNFDVVIHLAAKAGVRPSIALPEQYIDANLSQTMALLQWMKVRGMRKLVFASSSSVYGNNVKVPFAESDPVDHPISPYAFTKKAGELLTHTFHHLAHMDVINLRFFTVYGERQRPDLAIHKFAKAMLKGQAITLFGNGSTSRDYTYVGDIVQGIISSMEYVFSHEKVYETINLGSKNPIQLIDLVHTLEEIIGLPANIQWMDMQEGDVDRTFADIQKAERLLQYAPNTSLKEGLTRFVAWLKSNS